MCMQTSMSATYLKLLQLLSALRPAGTVPLETDLLCTLALHQCHAMLPGR